MSYFSMPHFDWLEGSGKITCSPFGREVAYIVGCSFGGIYNAPIDHDRTNWGDHRSMNIVVPQRDVSTWDGNALSLLVIFAHEMCIRVSIAPAIQWYKYDAAEETAELVSTSDRSDDAPLEGEWAEPCLRIWFHKRTTREGSIAKRHPTIEQAVEAFRSSYKHPNDIWKAIQDPSLPPPPTEKGEET